MNKVRLSFAAVFVVGLMVSVSQAALLAGWEVTGVDLDDGIGIETNIAPYTFSATTSDVENVSAQLVLGDGVNPSTYPNKYGFKISMRDSTNSLGGAIAKNHYMEFSLTVDAGYQLNLDSIEMKGYSTPTGCSNVVLMTSVDGFVDGQQIATATNANTTGGFDTDSSGFGAPIDLSAEKYQGLSGAMSFRIYGWGSSTNYSTGETAIRTYESVSDDLVIYGDIIAVSSSSDPCLSLEASNEWINVRADLGSSAATNYVLQSSTNLSTNVWSTVGGTFSSDTNWLFDLDKESQFFRIIEQ